MNHHLHQVFVANFISIQPFFDYNDASVLCDIIPRIRILRYTECFFFSCKTPSAILDIDIHELHVKNMHS